MRLTFFVSFSFAQWTPEEEDALRDGVAKCVDRSVSFSFRRVFRGDKVYRDSTLTLTPTDRLTDSLRVHARLKI